MKNEKQVIPVAIRGRGKENKQQLEVSNNEYANCITTVQKDSMIMEKFKIRKLTPKECWRLMGFKDEDYDKASKVNSKTQLYKQAGNSICVPVLEEIFKKFFNQNAS